MVRVEGLQFSYSKHPFLQDIGFSVGAGRIFGFLGPSGAGKSTLQKILTGLITNYEGSVQVGGVEVKHHNGDFYENIGVDFEFSALYEKLTARENLEYFASLYKKRGASPGELLEIVGLQNDGDKKVAAYSKGMKARLNFVRTLLHDPDILFLDEPTSGLDPTNSRVIKDIILQKRREGKAILLTTHNMYDATELCDEVAFLVNGRVCALDSPHNLMMQRGAATLRYTYLDGGEKGGECPLDQTANDPLLLRLVAENRLLSIHSGEPTLNDIFVDITGRTLQ